VLYYDLFTTLRGNVADRLYMSPVTKNKFFAGAIAWSWTFSILQAIIIFTVTYLAFPDNPYPSFWLLATMVLIVSILAQLKGALMPYIAKTRKAADGISAAICFGMMFLSGGLMINFGESDFAQFLMSRSNPLALGWSAIQWDIQYQLGFNDGRSGDIMLNIGILAAITVVLLAVLIVLGRRRKA